MAKDKELERYQNNSSKRIKWIVDNLCGGSQQKLADKANLNKGSVSQYVSGRNTPSNLTAKKIADVFNLNPAWIMGFEVPMYEESDSDTFRQEMYDEDNVLFDYQHLSEESKQTVRNVIKALKAQDDNS